jgi:hypothetical protein
MKTNALSSLKSAEVLNVDAVAKLLASADPAQYADLEVVDGRVHVLASINPVDRAVVGGRNYQEMAAARGIEWQPEYAERVLPWWASDERPDRHGDITRQYWDLDGYSKNPLVLYGHDWGAPPIGNSLGEQIITHTDDDYTGPAMLMHLLFANQTEAADSIFRLAKAKFLRTGSVGFFPGVVINVQDPDERQTLGLGLSGLIYGDPQHPNKLVEFTIASVPANPGARQAVLASMRKSGGLKAFDIQVIREIARQQSLRAGDDAAFKALDAQLRAEWGTLFEDVTVPPVASIHEPIPEVEKKTVSVVVPAKENSEPTVGAVLSRLDSQHEATVKFYAEFETSVKKTLELLTQLTTSVEGLAARMSDLEVAVESAADAAAAAAGEAAADAAPETPQPDPVSQTFSENAETFHKLLERLKVLKQSVDGMKKSE